MNTRVAKIGAVVLAVVVVAWVVAHLPAKVAARVQAPVVLGHPVYPGVTYSLPVRVTNTGSRDETITVTVRRHGHGRALNPSWFTARPVTVKPGKSARLALRVTIPASALPGRYAAVAVVTPAHGTTKGHPRRARIRLRVRAAPAVPLARHRTGAQ